MSASNCPETPRQKMIQMMYLVYTAMLALNVSAEVISGFKTVGQAMDQSNKNVAMKISDTFDNFKAAKENNPNKVTANYEKALEIQKMSDELAFYLDTTLYRFLSNIQSGKEAKVHVPDADTNNKKAQELKIQIRDDNKQVLFDSIARAIELGGFSWIDKLDDNHEATNFFLGHNPEGKVAADSTNAGIMKKKFIEYKRKIKELLGPDSMKVDLGLRVEPHEKYINPDGVAMTWEMLNFRETVAGAALVTLVRMKAEVLNAEYEAVNMLYKQISANDFSFSNIKVLKMPEKSYVMKDGTYELTIGVGAYDTKNPFDINIGGTTGRSNDSGVYVYKTVCHTTGPKTVTGTVYVKKDDGTTPYNFKEEYYVAEPLAVFELTEMNVVYKGINNPVRISVAGAAAHDIIPRVQDPSKADIVPDPEKGPGYYIINPKVSTGEVVINAYVKDGKTERLMGNQKFRVRMLPTPKIFIGPKESGSTIPINEIKGVKSIRVSYGPEFTFKTKPPIVTSQSVDIKGVNGASDLLSKNATWGPEIQGYLEKVRPGCKISIDAKVTLADGRTNVPVTATFRVGR